MARLQVIDGLLAAELNAEIARCSDQQRAGWSFRATFEDSGLGRSPARHGERLQTLRGSRRGPALFQRVATTPPTRFNNSASLSDDEYLEDITPIHSGPTQKSRPAFGKNAQRHLPRNGLLFGISLLLTSSLSSLPDQWPDIVRMDEWLEKRPFPPHVGVPRRRNRSTWSVFPLLRIALAVVGLLSGIKTQLDWNSFHVRQYLLSCRRFLGLPAGNDAFRNRPR